MAAASADPWSAAVADDSGHGGGESAAPQPGDQPLEWPRHGPLQSFPRGSGAGDCLHRILEQVEYQMAMDAPENRQIAERELLRAGYADQPLDPLLEGLERLRHTPFGGDLGGWNLAQLPKCQRLNEMGFDLSLELVRAADLAAVFQAHPGGCCDAGYAERLQALPVASRGFLTGSIDMACPIPDREGQPRWWVIDWKSNWLGERDGDGEPVACGPHHYQRPAMAELMLECHYPLQAHLYLVALHRYLRWRLPGYAPERHLGGYAYVFLRGVPGPLAASGGWDAGQMEVGQMEAGQAEVGPAVSRSAQDGQLELRLTEPSPGAEVPGIFLERPPLRRVLALEALFAGCRAEDKR